MTIVRFGCVALLSLGLIGAFGRREARAQAIGVELENTVMPASGGMGGESIARPQDAQSAVNGNPATLTQYRGTQFSFGGLWIEPTYNLDHSPPQGGILPGIEAFSGKSNAQGTAGGNIALTQDFSALGLPATFGVGLFAGAGAGVDYRGVPESNGTSALFNVLGIGVGLGVDLTDNWAVGGNIGFNTSTFDGPFVGISGATYDYALRGTVGTTYHVNCDTTLGFYYESRSDFRFENAVIFQLFDGTFSVPFDVRLSLPETLGFGFANESLMDGRLLVAVDVLYKRWGDAALFESLWRDQWAVQCGLQYRLGERATLRLGYVWADNPTLVRPDDDAGDVMPPGAGAAIDYLRALFPNMNQHRISGGIGMRNVLPGVDMNFFAGGMFRSEENYGDLNTVDLQTYWVGTGLTWRFGRGACCDTGVPDVW